MFTIQETIVKKKSVVNESLSEMYEISVPVQAVV